jgi:hypothetical protein
MLVLNLKAATSVFLITGNSFENCDTSCIDLNANAITSAALSISGNQFSEVGGRGGKGAIVRIYNFHGFSIVGNSFINYASGSDTAIYLNNCQQAQISNAYNGFVNPVIKNSTTAYLDESSYGFSVSNSITSGNLLLPFSVTNTATVGAARISVYNNLNKGISLQSTGSTYAGVPGNRNKGILYADSALIIQSDGASAASGGNDPIILAPGGYSTAAWTANVTKTGINISPGAGTATAANSALQTYSFATAYVSEIANYTATISDHTIDCTGGGTFTITLPTAVGITGREYVITNSGAGTITIATTSSQTFTNVSGTPTSLTITSYGAYTVKATGSAWVVENKL